MTYRIARNGQIYGPYSLAEVERYLASGNILFTDLFTDLAQSEGTAEWLPIAQLFPTAPFTAAAAGPSGAPYAAPGFTPPGYAAVPNAGPNVGSSYPGSSYPGSSYPGAAYPGAAYGAAVPVSFNPQLFPDPPDLPWWLALILGIITGGVFFVVWDIVQAAWMRKVEPRSVSIILYVAAGVLFLVNLQTSWHSIGYWMFNSPFVPTHHSGFVALLRWGIWLAARFVLRSELLTHFNTSEPLGLRLSGFLTLILGGLYFQYHFNQINVIKRSLRMSVPAV